MLQEVEQLDAASLGKDVVKSAELHDRPRPLPEIFQIGKAYTIDARWDAIPPLAPDQSADVEQDRRVGQC